MTAQSPVIETTSSSIGTNVTSTESTACRAPNRSQFSLMQTIPGLVPMLQVGSFEGGQFSANGQATTNNLFLVDGQYDNDSRLGGSQGTQARVSLDSMAEYQVQTHQYGAEYGGSTGVVVNSVTKSGSNKVAGRVFEYYQSNKLQATDYFLKQAGEENPESGSNVFGGSIGGPIVKNKFFYFGNYEVRPRARSGEPEFPGDRGAARRVVFDDDRLSPGPNTLRAARLPFERQQPAQLPVDARARADRQRFDRRRPGDSRRRAARERLGRPGLQLVVDVGPEQPHDQRVQVRPRAGEPAAGSEGAVLEPTRLGVLRSRLEVHRLPRAGAVRRRPAEHASRLHRGQPEHLRAEHHSRHHLRRLAHMAQVGLARGAHVQGRRGVQPQRRPAVGHGDEFHRPVHVPDRSRRSTPRMRRPIRSASASAWVSSTSTSSTIACGSYISDKWTVNNKLTLNLGAALRLAGRDAGREERVWSAVRIAYNLTGDGKTLIRGGVGKVYQYKQPPILITLAQRQVIAPTLAYDTAQVTSPAQYRDIPGGRATPTRPRASTRSPDRRRAWPRSARPAGRFSRAAQPGPRRRIHQQHHGRPDRRQRSRMQYTWAFSFGVKRELARNMAVSVDYVGNRGRDLTAVIDINEGPINPATGRVTRLGVRRIQPEQRSESAGRRARTRPSCSSTRSRRGPTSTPTSIRSRSSSRSGSRTGGPAA